MPDGTCSIEGCNNPVKTRGWCGMHYHRWQRYGDPLIVKKKGGTHSPILERFWAKVDKNGPDGCWIWTASTVNGYGQFGSGGRTVRAHRFAYELLIGPIPDGMHLDHLCQTPPCVNPAHLEPVLPAINAKRVGMRITACPQGHEYTPENTAFHNGARYCRQCARDSQKRMREAKKVAKPPRTECKNGHPWIPENIYTDAKGRKHCRKCNLEKQKAYKARKKRQM